jgi:branched-chain amino acid transport system ATP-binding protein
MTEGSPETILQVDDLTVRYGRAVALRGVSLRVERGQLATVIGSNGAGKSSLLGSVAGVVRAQGGRVHFAGDEVLGTSPERIARRGLSLVPEGRRIFASLSVEENLKLGAVSRPEAIGSGLDAQFERFPVLRRYRETPAGKLSGGEQQQLAIARALISQPRLLLLDEPSLGLAPRLVAQVFEILGELRSEGVTMLLVEQNARRALEIADVGYVLQGGQVQESGNAAELLASETIESAYLGGAA